jgi:tRNA A-37 threonylcarbamoyl transferase component Bud32
MAQVLLIIENFQPRLMNYGKTVDAGGLSVLAVDKWVFDRDVDRGLLGEALAGGLIFPYEPLVNGEYLLVQETTLKKRLILELLQGLVLYFPESSYEFYIKPEYFMYETLLTRARLFPPMLYPLSTLIENPEGLKQTLQGFLGALKMLQQERVISFSGEYVTLSKDFVDRARGRRMHFSNLFKTGQRALFASLVGILPQVINALSQNRGSRINLQRIFSQDMRTGLPIADPEAYVYLKTASGLAPLANRMDIVGFSRRILSANRDTQIKISNIGGILNDVYLVSANVNGKERRVVVKRFRDWSNFKWFPLTLWSVGTKTFAVLGRSRLERECAINHLLHSHGFAVPEVLYMSLSERLIFMEYIGGENLSGVVRRVVDSKRDDELKKALELIAKAGDIFAKVHALGVALGDTKPENILVDRTGDLYLTDLEQAGRNGDKAWDVAEFLYYAGHDISPFASTHRIELMANAFIKGYLAAGGNLKIIKNAGNPKYTKVFSIFTFPHIMLVLSGICRKANKLET